MHSLQKPIVIKFRPMYCNFFNKELDLHAIVRHIFSTAFLY